MALFAGAATAAAPKDDRISLAGPALFGEPTDSGHQLCAVGTDSAMLSYVATKAACSDIGKGRIVHRGTCKLAVKLFGKTGATLRLGGYLIEVVSGSMRLVAKLVDAEPVAWRSMVPQVEAPNTATVARADLVAALERCTAVYNPTGDLAKRTPSVNLRWDAAAAAPEVRVAFGDIRSARACRDAIPTKVLTSKVDISINPKHLLRLLEGLEGDDAMVQSATEFTNGTPRGRRGAASLHPSIPARCAALAASACACGTPR
jgi:hypothetical protein